MDKENYYLIQQVETMHWINSLIQKWFFFAATGIARDQWPVKMQHLQFTGDRQLPGNIAFRWRLV